MTLLGAATAAAVTLFDFPGRRFFEWALLLPLAMPAYVLAYAYTDCLQFSGPLQTLLRAAGSAARGALWPDVRSLCGAALLFVLCLYPYVYLLTRTALAERGAHLMEAARLLGAGLRRRMLHVALPLARPAIAAGVALALMETLADYGVGSYFGLTTFSTGIYKAWLVMDDRIAAAQLASLLLAVVALLLAAERRAQRRLRFGRSAARRRRPRRAPLRLRGGAALAAVAAVRAAGAAGFRAAGAVAAAAWLLGSRRRRDIGLPLAALRAAGRWASFKLAGVAAAAATALALALGFALRDRASRCAAPRPAAAGAQLVSLGYARARRGDRASASCCRWAGCSGAGPDSACGALVTGTVLGLIYAYLVRFSAVALQSVRGRLRARAACPSTTPRACSAPARCSACCCAAAPAAAAALGAGGGAAGLRRRDEGTAGDAGAAPLRQRHAGRGGLQPGARRAAGRSGAAVAGDRRGRAAAGAAAVAGVARPVAARRNRQPALAPGETRAPSRAARPAYAGFAGTGPGRAAR